MAIKIMRGDSYLIPVDIYQDGTPVAPELVREVEITIGTSLRKYFSKGEVTESAGTWYFRLSQEETFAMDDSSAVYVRVAYRGDQGDVVGTQSGMIIATETGSTEVI